MKAQLALGRLTGPYRKVQTLITGADPEPFRYPVTINVAHDRSPAYRQWAVRLEQEEHRAFNVTTIGDRNAVEGAAVTPDVGRAVLVRESLLHRCRKNPRTSFRPSKGDRNEGHWGPGCQVGVWKAGARCSAFDGGQTGARREVEG